MSTNHLGAVLKGMSYWSADPFLSTSLRVCVCPYCAATVEMCSHAPRALPTAPWGPRPGRGGLPLEVTIPPLGAALILSLKGAGDSNTLGTHAPQRGHFHSVTQGCLHSLQNEQPHRPTLPPGKLGTLLTNHFQ